MGLTVVRRNVEIDYCPRPAFVPFHERKQRFAIMVCHRRAGKTVADVNDIIRRAVEERKPDGRYGYIAPYRGQVKEIGWQYLKRFAAPLLDGDPNESELRVNLLGGQTLRLYGADNPDALRGGYLDGVGVDEFADIRPSLWTEVLRPMLADRQGWATIKGTPKGKNGFYDLDQAAKLKPAEWFRMRLRSSESGIIPQSELDSMLLEMGSDRYMQELECSFETAVKGAFYAEELRRAQEQNRIRPLPIERAVRVHTAWDLGRTDSTAIWFIQCVGRERRLIDYYESSGVGPDHYADVLEEKKRSKSNPEGYLYGKHYLPFDIAYTDWSATNGLSRKDTLEGLLCTEVQVVPQHNVLDGINAVRRMLDRTFIDPDRCTKGLEALRQYRRIWDEQLKDWKREPHHDWSSHGADALRYFTIGYEDPLPEKQEDRHRGHRESEQSAWGV